MSWVTRPIPAEVSKPQSVPASTRRGSPIAPAIRSILSAIDTDSPARGLYHSLGYQDLARQVLFPSAPKPYAVMGAPLPLRRR